MDTILLIDDDRDFGDALKAYLEFKGFEVDYVVDGNEGLAAIQEKIPDLVITDLIMPAKDGIGFLLDLPEEIHQKTKIIALSGGGRIAGHEYLENALEFGAADTLQKPFSFAVLHAKIQRLLHETTS